MPNAGLRTAYADEKKVHGFDFGPADELRLNAETIASVNSVVTMLNGVVVVPPVGPTILGNSISADGKMVNATITGGTPGVTYGIYCVATTSGNHILALEGTLFIETP